MNKVKEPTEFQYTVGSIICSTAAHETFGVGGCNSSKEQLLVESFEQVAPCSDEN